MTNPRFLSRLRIRRLAASHYAAASNEGLHGHHGTQYLVAIAMQDLRLGRDTSKAEVDRLIAAYLRELAHIVRRKSGHDRARRPFWIGFALELLGYTCVALLGLTIWIITGP